MVERRLKIDRKPPWSAVRWTALTGPSNSPDTWPVDWPGPRCSAGSIVASRIRRIGTARRRASAHQHRRIAVVAEADRMPQFMRDDVAGDIRHRQRRHAVGADHNHRTLAVRRAGRGWKKKPPPQHPHPLARPGPRP